MQLRCRSSLSPLTNLVHALCSFPDLISSSFHVLLYCSALQWDGRGLTLSALLAQVIVLSQESQVFHGCFLCHLKAFILLMRDAYGSSFDWIVSFNGQVEDPLKNTKLPSSLTISSTIRGTTPSFSRAMSSQDQCEHDRPHR